MIRFIYCKFKFFAFWVITENKYTNSDSTATADLYINKHKINTDGKSSVSIKITFNRERKYYKTGVQMTPDEFNSPRSKVSKSEIEFAKNQMSKAQVIVNDLSDKFTFTLFEKQFLKNQSAWDTLESAFDEYIATMSDDQVGNKSVYSRAQKSFSKFHPKAKFTDVTQSWLKRYEDQMLSEEKSITTVGMYTICLRTIFNKANINRDLYPFGRDKYIPPTSKNIKKALKLEDIAKIIKYTPEEGSGTRIMCRDLWLFIYFGNGLNVSDLCRLRNSNLKGNEIDFVRKKISLEKAYNKYLKMGY